MSLRRRLRGLLRRFHYDITPYPPDVPRRRRFQLFGHFGIDHVLDVGAGSGGYAGILRSSGYRGRITSFEPIPGSFRALSETFAADPLWNGYEIALGDADREIDLHIAGNSDSSSVLEMLPRHESAAPHACYVGVCRVAMRRLDSVFPELDNGLDTILLKLDTQGFERLVLAGAEGSLARITGLQLEMSLVPLYRGETLVHDMLTLGHDLGFALMNVEPGFIDPSNGQLLQMDGVFFRPGG